MTNGKIAVWAPECRYTFAAAAGRAKEVINALSRVVKNSRGARYVCVCVTLSRKRCTLRARTGPFHRANDFTSIFIITILKKK